jgi:VWA domain-containing protein
MKSNLFRKKTIQIFFRLMIVITCSFFLSGPTPIKTTKPIIDRKMKKEIKPIPKQKEDILPQEGSYYPEPKVFKNIHLPENIDCLDVGQEFSISIEVHGDSKVMDIPIPMDVVFVIDQSGSMEENDPDNIRLMGVRNFIDSLDVPSRNQQDKAAIIEFGSRAKGLSPQTSEGVAPNLTNNYDELKADLEAHNLFCTNIEEAMKLANQTLIQHGGNPNKLVVLLTDGWPMTQFSGGCYPNFYQQDTIVNQHIPDAITHDIRYYTIGLGEPQNICGSLLDNLIAQGTNGAYCHASSPIALPGCFADIFEEESYKMITQDIIVDERLTNGFKYKQGSLNYSGGIIPPSSEELNYFSSQGRIDIKIGQLLENQLELFSFIASCEECVTAVMPNETVSEVELLQTLSVDDSNSKVRYQLGDGVPREKLIPLKEVCVKRPGGPTIKKLFDDVKREVTIRIKSNYLALNPSHIIRDVHVWEVLSEYFEADRDPFKEYIGNFSIPPVDIEGTHNVAGKPWGFYYHWAVGDLLPQEEWEVKFRIRSDACHPLNPPPYAIDSRKPRSFVKVILPETTDYTEFEIPQALTGNDYPVPECPSETGFSNFSIEPAIQYQEEPSDHPLSREESYDIWIDSEQNGLVSDWRDTSMIDSSIKYNTHYRNHVRPVLFGDPLSLGKKTRVYMHYSHEGAMPSGDTRFILSAWPKLENMTWERTKEYNVVKIDLDPTTAVEGKLSDIVYPGPYLYFEWTPTLEEFKDAIRPTGITPYPLILEAVRLKISIVSPEGDEVFINDNVAHELIPEIIQ